jgi:hypothetical protein
MPGGRLLRMFMNGRATTGVSMPLAECREDVSVRLVNIAFARLRRANNVEIVDLL